MKQQLLTYLLILIASPAFSQVDYNRADSIAVTVKSKSFFQIHAELTKDLQSDEEKVRAFYTWIANNVNYDFNESLQSYKAPAKQMPATVIKSGRAICHGYAALFREFCLESQIPCHLVSGFTRMRDKFDNTGHTWNVVYINNSWHPVDATWGAGGVDANGKYIQEFSGEYFLTNPQIFLTNHYPFDPMWQLVEKPVMLDAYKRPNWEYDTTSEIFFNYNDTINRWQNLDSLDREFDAAARMVRFSPGDPIIKEQLSYVMFNKGNSEFEKGNKILENLYPRKKSGNQQQPTLNKKYHLAQLEITENHFKKAEAYYKQTQLRDPSDQAVLKSNLIALRSNVTMVQNQKTALSK